MDSTLIKALEVAATMTAAEVSAGRLDSDAALSRLFDHAQRIEAFIEESADGGTGNVLPFPQRPSVPVEESVRPDHLVCLEDGKKVQMLTRYLHRFGLTPDEYRKKWGLPDDYPMTSPNLSERKRTYAAMTGLGKHARN